MDWYACEQRIHLVRVQVLKSTKKVPDASATIILSILVLNHSLKEKRPVFRLLLHNSLDLGGVQI